MKSEGRVEIENSPEECTAGCTNLPSVIGMLASFFAAHIAKVLPVRARLLLWFHRLQVVELLLFGFKLLNHHRQAALVLVTNLRYVNMICMKGDGSGKREVGLVGSSHNHRSCRAAW